MAQLNVAKDGRNLNFAYLFARLFTKMSPSEELGTLEKERKEKKSREGVRRKENGRSWKKVVKLKETKKNVRGQKNESL